MVMDKGLSITEVHHFMSVADPHVGEEDQRVHDRERERHEAEIGRVQQPGADCKLDERDGSAGGRCERGPPEKIQLGLDLDRSEEVRLDEILNRRLIRRVDG